MDLLDARPSERTWRVRPSSPATFVANLVPFIEEWKHKLQARWPPASIASLLITSPGVVKKTGHGRQMVQPTIDGMRFISVTRVFWGCSG